MKILNNQQGQAFVEYAFLLSLIAMVAIVALAALGRGMRDFFATFGALAF